MKYYLVLLIFTGSALLKAQSNLTIEIVNLRNNEGSVAIELMDKNNKSIKASAYKIEHKKCTIILNDLENERYAVRFFHDENTNNELDKNFMGIPTEGFGISNNGMGKFGPKKFEEWLFSVSGDTKIVLTTKYYF